MDPSNSDDEFIAASESRSRHGKRGAELFAWASFQHRGRAVLLLVLIQFGRCGNDMTTAAVFREATKSPTAIKPFEYLALCALTSALVSPGVATRLEGCFGSHGAQQQQSPGRAQVALFGVFTAVAGMLRIYVLGSLSVTHLQAWLCLMPGLVALVARSLLRTEVITHSAIIGLCLGMFGAVLCVDHDVDSTSGDAVVPEKRYKGSAAAVVLVLIDSMLLLLQRQLATRHLAWRLTAWQNSISAAVTLLAVVPFNRSWNDYSVVASDVASLCYSALIALVLCRAAEVWASRHTSATIVATMTILRPPAYLLLSMLVQHHRPNDWAVFAMGLVFIGVLLVLESTLQVVEVSTALSRLVTADPMTLWLCC